MYVALGGLHVTSLPDEAVPHADTVFLGPGEQTFPVFLADFRAGQPLPRYVSTTGRTLDRLPPVRRDLIQRHRYLVSNSLVVTRHCPMHCDFCYKDGFFAGGRSFYTQRVDDALAEIERLPDAAGWKKFEPLWDVVIRAKRLAWMTPLLEAVLSRITRRETGQAGPAPRHVGSTGSREGFVVAEK